MPTGYNVPAINLDLLLFERYLLMPIVIENGLVPRLTSQVFRPLCRSKHDDIIFWAQLIRNDPLPAQSLDHLGQTSMYEHEALGLVSVFLLLDVKIVLHSIPGFIQASPKGPRDFPYIGIDTKNLYTRLQVSMEVRGRSTVSQHC